MEGTILIIIACAIIVVLDIVIKYFTKDDNSEE
jgi:hypothetical protein